MSKSLLLYGEIGWDIASKDVVPWLMENKEEKVDVHINSPGGDVFEAIAIYNALQDLNECTIYIDSIAASAAAIIALCGKPIVMGKFAQLMLHSASSSAYGNKKEMEEQMSMLDTIDHRLAAMVADKMGKTEEDIYGMYFDGKDHWISADEAASMGFATIPEREDDTVKEDDPYMNHHVPVFDSWNGRHHKKEQKPTPVNNMDIQKINAVPAFAECKDEESVLKKMSEMSDTIEQNKAKIEQLEILAQELATLKDEVKKKQDEADAKVIEEAVNDGRITDETKETFVNLMKSDRENTLKAIANLQVPKKENKRRVTDHIDDKDDGKGEEKKSAWDAYMETVNAKHKR